ncbi:MAG: sulfatase [Bacteroidaceae bacterium]|nr:sulfatase [Bacteroidaceae bacterium]
MKRNVSACVFAGIALNIASQEAKRWNIVHIMSDDHSYQAVSAYGHALGQKAPTRNIDQLAKRGMLFRRAYVENSLSTPSRACLMTGLYSHQNGQRRLGEGIDSTLTFVSELLRDAGYQTAVMGKWHLRCEPKGFDEYHILHNQGEYYKPRFRTPRTNGKYVPEKGYVTELITDHAIDFLKNRDKNRPFALFVHHKAPHRNWMPPTQYLSLYEDTQFPLPETFYDDYETRGKAAHNQEMSIRRNMELKNDLKTDVAVGADNHLGRMTNQQKQAWWDIVAPRNEDFLSGHLEGDTLLRWKFQRYVRDYMRCIHSVDEQVGRLVQYLESEGLMENTLIVYTSDQGFYMGEHGWFDKRFMYEESFRTPLIIYAPEAAEGKECSALVQNIDFAPTFLDVAGVEKPTEMVGTSLLPIIESGRQPRGWRKYLYYHYYDFPGVHHVSQHDGVSDGRYKLIHFYGREGTYDELYDLKTDPNELRNLISEKRYQRQKRRLQKQLDKFRTQEHVDEW